MKDRNVSVEMQRFYKSGNILLSEDEGQITAKSRYDGTDIIDSWSDIVSLNYSWWDSSKDRYDGWLNPENAFLQDFIDAGYVKAVTETKYVEA